MNITQGKLAEMFGMGAAKVSQILNGKREPDVHFLKAIHQKLGIDGNFILDRV
ncbi:MAG: helix-turn-helix transcriptional regulator [Dyadobacter sp.]